MKKSMIARFARERDGTVPLKPFDKDELIGRFKQVVSRSAQAEAVPSEKAKLVVEAAKDEDVKRQHQRRAKAIKACEIHFDDITTSGMVLSLSDGGAAVRLPQHLTKLPKYFTLKFSPGRSYDCQICWRARDKVGVAFV